MDDIVEQVKTANRIEDVIEETFPLARRSGRYLRAREHNSLVIDVHRQVYSWNSRSEIQGDVIAWVMARLNCDFKTAVEHLARRARLPEPRWSQQDQATRMAARAREECWVIAQRVLQGVLWNDADALAYCRARGWTDTTIRDAGLGYTGGDPAATGKALRNEFSLNGIALDSPEAVAICGFRGDVRAWAVKHGVELSGSQDRWVEWGFVPSLIAKKRLIYPHWSAGRVKTFSGRNILGAERNEDGSEIKSYNLPVAVGGNREPFYNQCYAPRADECVIVEGQADAITLGQWGIPAVALGGTAHQDKPQLMEQLRKRHPRLYIGMDNDQAGQTALIGRRREWPLASLLGPLTRVLRWGDAMELPDGAHEIKDANDLLRYGMGALGLTDYQPTTAAASDLPTSEQHPDAGPNQEQRLVEEQTRRVREFLRTSRTMVEEAAEWTGKQEGPDRDEAIRTTFGIVKTLDKLDRANYRERLADLMGIGLREFNDMLKAIGQEDRQAIQTVETLGGYIEGWLLEFVYDPTSNKARLAWRDPDRKIGVSDFVEIAGVRYVPRTVTQFIKEGGVLFAADLGPLKSTRELVAICEAFVNQHYLLENRYLGRIIAYYILLTWVYDAFNALPYLRAMGEAGAGKSELMKRVGHLCYRLLTASGANTAATFFRATETYRGTVFLDEADLADGGDMANDLVKFLNLGAMKGNSIWRMQEVRTETGSEYEVATFSTFCPKLIAMRRDFKDDAVGSRSLTIRVMPREPMELKERGIRLYVDDEFRERARAIRNLLLRWRLEHWEPEIPVTEEHMDLDISSRLNQVTMPLKALAADDPHLQDEITKFLRAYNQEMVLTRSMTIAARIVEAMWNVWTQPDLRQKYLGSTMGDDGYYIMIGDVAKVANGIIDSMNSDEDEEDDEEGRKRKKRDALTARGVGSIIRNELQLHVGERRGKGFPVFWDEIKMQALAKRYGVQVYNPQPTASQAPTQAGDDDMPPPPEPPDDWQQQMMGL